MTTLSVPGWATWTWSTSHDDAKHPARRIWFDELCSSLASKCPLLRFVQHVNGSMPCTLIFSESGRTPLLVRRTAAFVDAWLRSASQVVILNNPLSGLLIVLACCFPSVVVGAHGALGLSGAVVAALLIGFDRQALASGLFGYNGLLVGMALSTFLYRGGGETWDAPVAIACVFGGGLSAILQLSLGNALVPTFRTPPFTLAFNLTMLLFVLATPHFAVFRAAPPAPTPTATAVDEENAPAGATVLGWLFEASLVSISQIFVCQSAVSGALILCGMLISSRIAAVAAFVGAFLGVAMAYGVGAPAAQIADGLWGYNSSLTAIAALTFFVRHGVWRLEHDHNRRPAHPSTSRPHPTSTPASHLVLHSYHTRLRLAPRRCQAPRAS